MSTTKTVDKAEAETPRCAWRAELLNAILEVFSTMVGVSVSVPAAKDDIVIVPESDDDSVLAYVTGMIGIAGAVRAIFSLRCSEKTATKITAQMLGISKEEATTQKSDAIGEMCNMIAGHFKHKIGYGDDCTLTVPTVVEGGKYSIYCLEADQRLELPVIYEGETVLVALDIHE
jgi:CheY-specific phosphatase CheX